PALDGGSIPPSSTNHRHSYGVKKAAPLGGLLLCAGVLGVRTPNAASVSMSARVSSAFAGARDFPRQQSDDNLKADVDIPFIANGT
ncbi:hypothetical protein, partial [Klebsiella pneumoniae]